MWPSDLARTMSTSSSSWSPGQSSSILSQFKSSFLLFLFIQANKLWKLFGINVIVFCCWKRWYFGIVYWIWTFYFPIMCNRIHVMQTTQKKNQQRWFSYSITLFWQCEFIFSGLFHFSQVGSDKYGYWLCKLYSQKK